jgi:signal transduction histidine kinase/ActR/RegA family two-component response regulator
MSMVATPPNEPSDASPPEVPAFARLLPPVLAAVLIVCSGIAAWSAFTPPVSFREPARTYALWHESEATAAFARLQHAAAAGQGAESVAALARKFAQAVTRSRQAASVPDDPAVNVLADRLEEARKRLAISPNGVSAALANSDELIELTGLLEAANQEGAVFAERDADAADRMHWLLVGMLVLVTAIGLVSIAGLTRRLRDLAAVRHALDATTIELQDAKNAAGQAAAAKAHFMAAATHELRAPIETMMSLTNTLLEEALDPSQREVAVRIRDAAGNLPRVLDDAQDYVTLESGEMTTDERVFSPEAVTKAAVLAIESQARAKGLTIVSTPAPGLPKLLLGDCERVSRILFRLANNAVRFTGKGGVSLQVLCAERSAGHATIEWVVTDTGAGMDQSRLDRLRGAESPEDGVRTGSPPEAGMGLSLCQRLATRMGGAMTFESGVGEGTRVRVRLPFKTAANVARTQAPPSAAPLRDRLRAMGRRPRLLMAEDTPAGQFILRQLLAREGIAPEMVADGRAAVLAADAERYDVICMDLRMPEMDGLEAARRIRSGRGQSAKTPIIAVTASTSPADVQACKDAGMTMFVGKPVGRETLLNAILAALNENRAIDPPIESDRRQPAH